MMLLQTFPHPYPSSAFAEEGTFAVLFQRTFASSFFFHRYRRLLGV
jgi:hypothetical protein